MFTRMTNTSAPVFVYFLSPNPFIHVYIISSFVSLSLSIPFFTFFLNFFTFPSFFTSFISFLSLFLLLYHLVPFSPSTLLSSFVSFCHFCHWLRFLRPPFPVLMLHLREHTPTSAPRCAMLICTLAPTPPMS